MPPAPLWLSVARAFEGLAEVAGPTSNRVILNWAKDLHAPYVTDETAWCALFLNRILLACQLPVAGTGYDLLRAKTFETWGQPMARPAYGAVMVFTRPGGNHVGLYLGEASNAYLVLGGNTQNQVGSTWIGKSRLTAIRWAASEIVPLHAEVLLSYDGRPLSTNEG